jgi:hypothetical protein
MATSSEQSAPPPRGFQLSIAEMILLVMAAAVACWLFVTVGWSPLVLALCGYLVVAVIPVTPGWRSWRMNMTDFVGGVILPLIALLVLTNDYDLPTRLFAFLPIVLGYLINAGLGRFAYPAAAMPAGFLIGLAAVGLWLVFSQGQIQWQNLQHFLSEPKTPEAQAAQTAFALTLIRLVAAFSMARQGIWSLFILRRRRRGLVVMLACMGLIIGAALGAFLPIWAR